MRAAWRFRRWAAIAADGELASRPVGLAELQDGELRLRCRLAEFDELDAAGDVC